MPAPAPASRVGSIMLAPGNGKSGKKVELTLGGNISQGVSVLNPKRLMVMIRKSIGIPAIGLLLAAGMVGCRVHVDKDANGQEKTVQVDTPFGGVHVNTDQVSASDLGLPV